MVTTTVFRAVIRKQVHLNTTRQFPKMQKRQSTTQTQPKQRQHNGSSKMPDPVPVAGTVGPLPFWQRLGPLTRAAEAYARAQRRRPYLTQIASALGIYLCADTTAQYMGENDFDPTRTARSLIIGGVAAIPNWEWYVFLSKNFNYSSRWLSIATKVAVNMICFTPSFNVYFFGSQALLSGESLDTTFERVKNTVPVSTLNAVKVWPAATAFSFAFIPLEYRAIFAGVIAVGWQSYLAIVNRQAEMLEAQISHNGKEVVEHKQPHQHPLNYGQRQVAIS